MEPAESGIFEIPAICEDCGCRFASGIGLGVGISDAGISDVRVGPCPRCEGVGRCIDGAYEVTGHDEAVVTTPAGVRLRLRQLREIRHLVDDLRRDAVVQDDLERRVEALGLPEDVKATLRTKWEDVPFGDKVQILLATLAILLGLTVGQGVADVAREKLLGPSDVDRLITKLDELSDPTVAPPPSSQMPQVTTPAAPPRPPRRPAVSDGRQQQKGSKARQKHGRRPDP